MNVGLVTVGRRSTIWLLYKINCFETLSSCVRSVMADRSVKINLTTNMVRDTNKGRAFQQVV